MSLSLLYNFKKQIDMLHDLITEETEVFYTNDVQLSFEFDSRDYD